MENTPYDTSRAPSLGRQSRVRARVSARVAPPPKTPADDAERPVADSCRARAPARAREPVAPPLATVGDRDSERSQVVAAPVPASASSRRPPGSAGKVIGAERDRLRDGFGALLAAERMRAGFTVKGLAEQSGLTVSTLYGFEGGRIRPREDVCHLLALIITGRNVDAAEQLAERLMQAAGDSLRPGGRRSRVKRINGMIRDDMAEQEAAVGRQDDRDTILALDAQFRAYAARAGVYLPDPQAIIHQTKHRRR